MKFRMTKGWNLLVDTIQLSKKDIEAQVSADLIKYRQLYSRKYGAPAPVPLDVDNFVQELHGFSVCFEQIENTDSEEVLGFLRPETKQVIVSESCVNQKRISFTIAHEAGHLALHKALFASQDGTIIGWKKCPLVTNAKKMDSAEIRREWQANVYAGTLLATKIDVELFLKEIGVLRNGVLAPFSLDALFPKFEEHFGLSRQALEIRLSHLNIAATDFQFVKI